MFNCERIFVKKQKDGFDCFYHLYLLAATLVLTNNNRDFLKQSVVYADMSATISNEDLLKVSYEVLTQEKLLALHFRA